jgi:hypothetical protein
MHRTAKHQMTLAEWREKERAWLASKDQGGFTLISLAEMDEFYGKHPKPQVVRYSTSEGVPSFDVLNEEAESWYEIVTSRCNTGAKLVEWVGHLLEKEWVTKDHIEQLINLVTKHYPTVRQRNC